MPALRAVLADATLGVKSNSNDWATRDDRGNDEARSEPVRRLKCAARGADGIGAIGLSEPAGENPGRFYARHGAGSCGAHSCRPVFGSLGHAVRGRERSRRRQQRRHRSRRQGGRRRLHAADGRQPVAGHQSEPVRKTAVRSDQGFCADLAGVHRGQRARRSDRVAGQVRGGAGGVRQSAARQALLCACRRRHVAASRRRIVQIHGACSISQPCPIAAARR